MSSTLHPEVLPNINSLNQLWGLKVVFSSLVIVLFSSSLLLGQEVITYINADANIWHVEIVNDNRSYAKSLMNFR